MFPTRQFFASIVHFFSTMSPARSLARSLVSFVRLVNEPFLLQSCLVLLRTKRFFCYSSTLWKQKWNSDFAPNKSFIATLVFYRSKNEIGEPSLHMCRALEGEGSGEISPEDTQHCLSYLPSSSSREHTHSITMCRWERLVGGGTDSGGHRRLCQLWPHRRWRWGVATHPLTRSPLSRSYGTGPPDRLSTWGAAGTNIS
jgi:hypothetical protein